MTEKAKSTWWPPVDTIEQASSVKMYGVWAAVAGVVITSLFAGWALYSGTTVAGTIDASAFIDAAIFAAVAYGTYKESRFAAVAGLVIFIIEKIYMFAAAGRPSGIFMALLFIWMYVLGVRGVFALHKLRAQANAG